MSEKLSMSTDDLPTGYRQTELGPLPEEWRVAGFDECVIRIARVPKVKQSEYRNIGLVPIIDQGQSFIAGYTDEIVPYEHELPAIVFGDHTRVFKFIDFPFVAGADGTHVLVPNRRLFEPMFLYFAFLNLDIPSRGYNRHLSLLREKNVPLPPLAEQRAIAHVLRTVQEAKEATARVIAAARELKKSLMRHLFTYGPVPVGADVEARHGVGARHAVPLQETEIGPLPAHWRVVRLGEVFDIMQGKSLSAKRNQGLRSRYFLRTSNVYWGYLDLGKLDTMDFTEDEEQRYALRYGDLLVCEGGEVGRTAMWEDQIQRVYFQNHLHRLRAKDSSVAPAFVMYWMQTAFTLLNSYSGTSNKTTIPNLSQGRLAAFSIPLPPLAEQQEIARILQAVDEKIRAEEARKAALEGLFRSLLHHLMTAKIRLPVGWCGTGEKSFVSPDGPCIPRQEEMMP